MGPLKYDGMFVRGRGDFSSGQSCLKADGVFAAVTRRGILQQRRSAADRRGSRWETSFPRTFYNRSSLFLKFPPSKQAPPVKLFPRLNGNCERLVEQGPGFRHSHTDGSFAYALACSRSA